MTRFQWMALSACALALVAFVCSQPAVCLDALPHPHCDLGTQLVVEDCTPVCRCVP